jgi:hypothetical protein
VRLTPRVNGLQSSNVNGNPFWWSQLPWLAVSWGESAVALPEVNAAEAEGDLPSGHHWRLTCSGSGESCYTFLEVLHPDGRKDRGGMGGPALYPGSDMNVYTGSRDDGLLRVIIRAAPRAHWADITLSSGETIRLAPAIRLTDMGIVVFAALLPRTAGPVGCAIVDAEGSTIA